MSTHSQSRGIQRVPEGQVVETQTPQLQCRTVEPSAEQEKSPWLHPVSVGAAPRADSEHDSVGVSVGVSEQDSEEADRAEVGVGVSEHDSEEEEEDISEEEDEEQSE